MLIGGWQKTSLIDFPNRVASTIFTVGCNFRCPYCHNPELVEGRVQLLGEREILEFLEKRKKIIDGVCITGGEPTMQKDLVEFCRKVRDLGLEVKLDTNGSKPEVVGGLIREKLLDYVALDFKTRFVDYPKVTNFQFSIFNFQKILKLLKKSKIDFELRTTVVPGIHDEKVIKKMAEEIRDLMGAPPLRGVQWWLQNFRAGNCLDKSYNRKRGFSRKELEKLKIKAEGVIKGVKVRES